MNLKTLRSKMMRAVAAFATVTSAVILGSCGGGGAGSSNTGSILTILPSAGTFYAGVPYEFTIAGGVVPYLVTSSQPDIFSVPRELNGHTFTVIPNNPGVVDSGLAVGALQGRTVVIQVRDKNGALAATNGTNGIFIAQNFMTGYGVFYRNNCQAPVGGGAQAQACAGGETILSIAAVTNGGLFSNRNFRLDVIRGPFGWLDCDPITGTVPGTVPSSEVPKSVITCPTDHEGKANVRLRVQVGAATQLGSYRITDVASGVTTTQVISIDGTPPSGGLTLIPDDFTMAGPAGSTRCGSGPVSSLVFDGTPPYTATSSTINFSAQVDNNQVRISGSGICDEGSIVVVDSLGRRGTITVKSEASTTPPPALQVAPSSVDLVSACGYSASVAYIGGAGPISAFSDHPRVRAQVAGGFITIVRVLSDATAVPPFPFAYPTSATIQVSDGTLFLPIAVNNVAASCP